MKLSQMVEQAKTDSIIENDTTAHVEHTSVVDETAEQAARDAAELQAVINDIKNLAGC